MTNRTPTGDMPRCADCTCPNPAACPEQPAARCGLINIDGESARVQADTDMPAEVRDALEDVIRTVQRNHGRCPSCDHPVSLHQPDGCRFHVTEGTVGRDLVCPCSAPRTAPDQPEETR